MLYYAVLCCAVLCCAVLCCAVLCCAMLYYAVLCYAMLCYAMLYYAVLCCAMLCYTMLCYVMLCYAMLCYAKLYYALLCYAVLCCALLSLPPFLSFFFSSLFSLLLPHISLLLPFPHSHTAQLYSAYHIISHHITLYHIISHHMMSGSMPRCMDVICRNEVVEQAKAGKKTLIYNYHQIIWWNLHISFFTLSGDKIVFTGTLAVIPDSGGLSRVGEATLGGKT